MWAKKQKALEDGKLQVKQEQVQNQEQIKYDDTHLEDRSAKLFFDSNGKPYRKYLLTIVIIVFMIFGAGVKYSRFIEGQPLTPVAVAGNIIKVENFEAKLMENSLVVKLEGEVGISGYFSVDNQTSLRDLIDYVGVKAEGDLSLFEMSHKLMQGDEFYVKNKHDPLDIKPWYSNNQKAKPLEEVENPASLGVAVVNINTADLAELDTLPGIGPAKAKAIIDYRNQKGKFVYKEDILGVKGIGEKLYEEIVDKITV